MGQSAQRTVLVAFPESDTLRTAVNIMSSISDSVVYWLLLLLLSLKQLSPGITLAPTPCTSLSKCETAVKKMADPNVTVNIWAAQATDGQ